MKTEYVDGYECELCPNCNNKTVEQTSYDDGDLYLHCLDCGWIDPETGKPELEDEE